jgi:hypothetical protein
MEKALYGPAGRSWLKVALLVAGSWLFMLVWFAAWSWPIWSAEWGYSIPSAIVLAGFRIVPLALVAGVYVSWGSECRHDREWARLDID